MDNFINTLINISPSLIAFAATAVLLFFLPFGKALLGHDRGRKYVEGSEVNIGKPTGVGFYFAIVIAAVSICFRYSDMAIVLSASLSLLAMISGFLDDRAKTPWNEYFKGALDFGIALIGAWIATSYMSNDIVIGLTGTVIHIPSALYFVLAVILIIVSINATNATDGVDGLSGTLTVITFFSFNLLSVINSTINGSSLAVCETVIGSMLAYLIFNFNPSKMLMGDAGSRSLGLLIALYAMYVKMPLAYLAFGLPFMIDGGLSILKITIGRLTKKKIIILKNTLTPIHDHLKKQKGYSIKQTWLAIVAFALIVDVIYIGIAILLHK